LFKKRLRLFARFTLQRLVGVLRNLINLKSQKEDPEDDSEPESDKGNEKDQAQRDDIKGGAEHVAFAGRGHLLGAGRCDPQEFDGVRV